MMKRLHYILALFCAITMLSACNDARSPHSSTKHLFEAIEQGDYPRAAEFTTLNPDEDLELYYAIMQKQQASITEKGGIKKIEILKESYSEENPDKAIVVVLITYHDGSYQEEYCTLSRVNKRWLLDVNLNSK